jgi:hypothetical protein
VPAVGFGKHDKEDKTEASPRPDEGRGDNLNDA